MITRLFFGGIIYNGVESLVDNFVLDNVTPVAGSVVYCDIYAVEHSGIALNSNEIIHLNGDGLVEIVSYDEFRNRLGGWNNAMSVYTSSYKDDEGDVFAIGSEEAAVRARALVGTRIEYSLWSRNCHNFTAYCLLGVNSSISYFYELRAQAERKLGINTWRVAI